MPDRLIRLRRPPVLSQAEGPFVPEGASLDEIDRLWSRLCERNPKYFDGPCWHVLGVHRNGHGGATLHVVESSYRFYAVQNPAFDVGFRGLGVRAIAQRGESVLMGRRAAHVAHYPGQWEFVPAGKLEPGVDPARMIVQELSEETGLSINAAPTPIAVLFDGVARTWEIIFRLNVSTGDLLVSSEHDELTWRDRRDLPADLAPVDRQMLELL